MLGVLSAVLMTVPGVWGAEIDCPAPEPGLLTLDTAPWTMVYVDGEYAGSTPLYRHELAPGPHTLTLVNDVADVHREEDVVIEEGQARKLKVLLVTDETALDASRDVSGEEEDCFVPDEEAAFLTVDTQPWSQVFIDGKLLGDTPVFAAKLAPGDHTARFVRGDGQQAFARFHAGVGETIKLSFSLD